MRAMRKTIKFAIDLRAGDSKPVGPRDVKSVGSRSLLSFGAQLPPQPASTSNLIEMGNASGGTAPANTTMNNINQEAPATAGTNPPESPYATFNDNLLGSNQIQPSRV